MTSDPALRRDTPLAAKLKAQIREHGPMSVAQFMTACLLDPEFGYYRSGNVLGGAGDFITAPEISQTFGELIGLWCVAVWQQLGAPGQVQIIELGAGRGTLLADALRAAKQTSHLVEAVSLQIVDTHQGLREQQAKTLKDYAGRITWVDDLTSLDDVPTLLIANEFLDCLPVEQYIAAAANPPNWHQRCVGLEGDSRLQFTTRPGAAIDAEDELLRSVTERLTDVRANDILEVRPLANSALAPLFTLAFLGNRKTPFAGLFFDYGHTESRTGETLQSVRAHKYEHPLTSPGEADLTAHVDFGHFARHMSAHGFAVDGPIDQGTFLSRLGIVERASRLMAQNPQHAADIETAVARLISPSGMGSRFKTIAIKTPGMGPLPGFMT